MGSLDKPSFFNFFSQTNVSVRFESPKGLLSFVMPWNESIKYHWYLCVMYSREFIADADYHVFRVPSSLSFSSTFFFKFFSLTPQSLLLRSLVKFARFFLSSTIEISISPSVDEESQLLVVIFFCTNRFSSFIACRSRSMRSMVLPSDEVFFSRYSLFEDEDDADESDD